MRNSFKNLTSTKKGDDRPLSAHDLEESNNKHDFIRQKVP